MEQHVTVAGKYARGSQYAAVHWEQICADHEEEFPEIRQCHPGTFNVVDVMTDGKTPYRPPGEDRYRQRARERGQSVRRYVDGNHLSPRAKVIEINRKPVEAWIYRGGNPDTVLELVSPCRLAEHLVLREGDTVTGIVIEFSEEGGPGMPGPPSPDPGKTVALA